MSPADKAAKAEQKPVRYESRYLKIGYPTAPNGRIDFQPNGDDERPRGEYVTSDPAEIAFLDAATSCERSRYQ